MIRKDSTPRERKCSKEDGVGRDENPAPYLINHKCFLKAIRIETEPSSWALCSIFGFMELRLKKQVQLTLSGVVGFDWLDSLSVKTRFFWKILGNIRF
ncbi:hypothetical protein CEXT_44321 [Caerostris extrusa]|uniref:Uncharacterized protein n=1 Tax=Caerostris extrusa TaxID=172846 RepID=A0AAV4ST27_CAEEX|nr:hypothetical protein CEXT_44321 [Caerostris extrusa]